MCQLWEGDSEEGRQKIGTSATLIPPTTQAQDPTRPSLPGLRSPPAELTKHLPLRPGEALRQIRQGDLGTQFTNKVLGEQPGPHNPIHPEPRPGTNSPVSGPPRVSEKQDEERPLQTYAQEGNSNCTEGQGLKGRPQGLPVTPSQPEAH